jgi:hypothetical protein
MTAEDELADALSGVVRVQRLPGELPGMAGERLGLMVCNSGYPLALVHKGRFISDEESVRMGASVMTAEAEELAQALAWDAEADRIERAIWEQFESEKAILQAEMHAEHMRIQADAERWEEEVARGRLP